MNSSIAKDLKSENLNIIAYIFSPPRSLSVACMRMMEAYGFTVFHEPLLPSHDGEQFPEWFRLMYSKHIQQ